MGIKRNSENYYSPTISPSNHKTWPSKGDINHYELLNCNKSPKLVEYVTKALSTMVVMSSGILPFAQNVYMFRNSLLWKILKSSNVDVRVVYWYKNHHVSLKTTEAVPILCSVYWERFINNEYEKLRLTTIGASIVATVNEINIVLSQNDTNFLSLAKKLVLTFNRGVFRDEVNRVIQQHDSTENDLEDSLVKTFRNLFSAEIVEAMVVLAFAKPDLWTDFEMMQFSGHNIYEFESMVSIFRVNPIKERELRRSSNLNYYYMDLNTRVTGAGIFAYVLLSRYMSRVWIVPMNEVPMLICNDVFKTYKNLDFLIHRLDSLLQRRNERAITVEDFNEVEMRKRNQRQEMPTSFSDFKRVYDKFSETTYELQFLGDNTLTSLIKGNRSTGSEKYTRWGSASKQNIQISYIENLGKIFKFSPTMHLFDNPEKSSIFDLKYISDKYKSFFTDIKSVDDLNENTMSFIKDTCSWSADMRNKTNWSDNIQELTDMFDVRIFDNFLSESYERLFSAVRPREEMDFLVKKPKLITDSLQSNLLGKEFNTKLLLRHNMSLLYLKNDTANDKDSIALAQMIMIVLTFKYAIIHMACRMTWRKHEKTVRPELLDFMFPSVNDITAIGTAYFAFILRSLDSAGEKADDTKKKIIQYIFPVKEDKKGGKGNNRGGASNKGGRGGGNRR